MAKTIYQLLFVTNRGNFIEKKEKKKKKKKKTNPKTHNITYTSIYYIKCRTYSNIFFG